MAKTRRRRRVTAQDINLFKFISQPQVSPDGDEVVYLQKTTGQKNEYVRNLWMVATDGGAPRQFTSGGRDSHPRWSPDGSRIAFIGGRTKGHPQLYTISADGGEAVALTSFPEGSIGTFKWSPDGSMIAASFREADSDWTTAAKKERKENGRSDPPRVIDHWWYRLDGDGYFGAQRYQLVLIDTETGEHEVVDRRDTLGFFSFDFSPDSKQLVFATNRDRRAGLKAWSDQLFKLRISTGKVSAIPNLPDGPKDAVAWSPDGRTIAYAGRTGGDDATYSTENLELWVCDPVHGRPRSLTGKEDYCLMAAPITDTGDVQFAPIFHWSADSKRLHMQIGWHGECHLASVRRAGGPITFHTAGRRVHQLGNRSADGRVTACTVGSATELDEVYIARWRGTKATLAACTNANGPLLLELLVAKPKSQWIKSASGTRIHLWTMLPPGGARSRRSAVLEIHGGPHTQYGESFFHEFQVLAGLGHIVFYSNPRGSKGYGRDHCAAIRGRWGVDDWEDIEAVIEHMQQHPRVDRKRMGIMGGSYGGYMTNWAIGHCRDFAGAITDRCVSNMVSMGGSSDFVDPPDLYFPGNFWDRPEARWEQSPIKYIGKANTPTLIIHSEGDLRCNIEQAEQVYVALTLRKVPTRFVRYPASTSHGLSRGGPPDLRIHRLEQIVEWWRKYLK